MLSIFARKYDFLDKQTTYRTLQKRSEGLYKEKGSKFIGIAVPCFEEEEVKTYLEAWKKEHYQAGHLCYAYMLGADKSRFRANDDGEPSNSAGTPILGQIQSFELTNLLIGVVRYYGGTKLGVGGLIQAYRTAAREAIASGIIIEAEVFTTYSIEFSFDEMPFVMNELKSMELEIIDQVFNSSCKLEIRVPLRLDEFFKSRITSFKSLKIN